VTDQLIASLESTRGYIDGMLADIRGSNPSSDIDALDFITATRRLRVKTLVVLEEAVHHAAGHTNADLGDIATRYGNGLGVEDVVERYPDIPKLRAEYERRRAAWEDDKKAWG
jgi:hypothetical protein